MISPDPDAGSHRKEEFRTCGVLSRGDVPPEVSAGRGDKLFFGLRLFGFLRSTAPGRLRRHAGRTPDPGSGAVVVLSVNHLINLRVAVNELPDRDISASAVA